MAYIEEVAEWTDGVRRIEKTERVLGASDDGPGIDNLPLIDLACRTSYLKHKIGNVEVLV